MHGTSGMRQGGTPGAFPHSVPPNTCAGGGRTLHVPPPKFTWMRAKGNVLVNSPFAEYDPVGADSGPTDSTASAASANAGHCVSTLNACSAPMPVLAIPVVGAEPAARTYKTGTRNSISVIGRMPYESFGSTRKRSVPLPTHSPRRGSSWISSSPRAVGRASSMRAGRPESRL